MRVVLDTNVVLSAMLFEKGRMAWLRELWMRGEISTLISTPCVQELLRVLAYPKFRLAADEIETLLGNYLPYAEVIDTTKTRTGSLPVCRDLDDQKFLVLAHAGKADVLVTGDRALLSLAGQARFAIETPAQFQQRYTR